MEEIVYQSVSIKKHNMSFTNDFWYLDYNDKTQEVIFSRLIINAVQENNVNNGKDINIALILRNQNDFSNVVILVGVFNIKSEFQEDKEMTIFVEYLFEKAQEYIDKIELKGKDDLLFKLPKNNYSYGRFQ
jgi:hypothetical protein